MKVSESKTRIHLFVNNWPTNLIINKFENNVFQERGLLYNSIKYDELHVLFKWAVKLRVASDTNFQ